MASNILEIILKELGKTALIPIIDLMPDRHNSCLIQLPGDLKIQIELDKTERNLLIGSDLGEVPVGRYRADLFREALRANSTPWPRYGDFAYSTKTSHLILFELMLLEEANGERVAEHLKPFLEKATIWIDAIKNNTLPTNTPSQAPGLGSLFGLR